MEATRTSDYETARKAAGKLLVRARTYQRNQADRWNAKADEAQEFESSAENLRTACDTSLNFLSMGGGKPLLYAYQAGTGYIDGGPLQAIENVARSYSDAVDYVFTGIEGYKAGGAKGVASAVGWQFAQNLVFEKVMGRLMGDGGHGNPPPTVKEQFEAAKWKQEAAWGKAQVKQFEDAQEALMKAGKAGASAQEIARLQGQVREFAIAINSSPMAKNFIKYQAPRATGRAFDLNMQGVYADVDRLTHQTMREWHWNMDDLVVQDFRNASSFGLPNMDRDWGLNEVASRELQARRLRTLLNASRPNPSLDARAADYLQINWNGEHRSIAQFQDALGKSYHDAYKQVTGRTADSAAQAITTASAHNEAFKDVCVLSGRAPDANWIGQTMDAVRYKVNLPMAESGMASFSHFTKQQESARALGKELEKKLLPIVKGAKPKSHVGTPEYWQQHERLEKTREHLREVQTLCESFGQGKMDPLAFQQQFKQLTGGKNLNQVTDEVCTLIEGMVKFKAHDNKISPYQR